MAQFPDGARSEDLRIRFEQITGLRRQSYYDSLDYCKRHHWLVGGGKAVPYQLNPDLSWKLPQTPAEEMLDRDRLAHVVNTQAAELEGLRGEIARFSDANGAGVAVGALVKIVGDGNATPRQRIKAASTILGYRTQDDDVVQLAKKFLQSVCTDIGVAIDYRIEASEALRRSEDPKLVPVIERPARAESVNAEPVVPLAELLLERKRYCDEMTAQIAAEMGLNPTVHNSGADAPDRSNE